MENKPLNKTLLIVEDDSSLLRALSDRFADEGFKIIQAKNGEEGLESALKNRPDLILLDIIMPKMDGITMMKKLREDSWGEQVPVIILTNLSIDDKILNDISQTEPVYYLVKTDWDMEAVVKKVKSRLGIDGDQTEF